MRKQLKKPGALGATRANIIELLRRAPCTVAEIASQLGMTYHAVRLHVMALDRAGMIRVSSMRGSTRPASVYETVSDLEASLSRAYVPFAAQLTRVLSERLPARRTEAIMRAVGRRLAAMFPKPQGALPERVSAASGLLHELGAPNEIARKGPLLQIRSAGGCLLAEAVHERGEVCIAMETMLAEYLDADVQQRCDRGARPRCCFEIKRAS